MPPANTGTYVLAWPVIACGQVVFGGAQSHILGVSALTQTSSPWCWRATPGKCVHRSVPGTWPGVPH